MHWRIIYTIKLPALLIVCTLASSLTSSKHDQQERRAIAQTMDGRLLTVGINWLSKNSEQAIFIQFDNEPEIFLKTSRGEERYVIHAVVPSYDGEFLLAGYYAKDDEEEHPWLLRFDRNGQILSERIWHNRHGQIKDIVQDIDGDFFVTGQNKDKICWGRLPYPADDLEGSWRPLPADGMGESILLSQEGLLYMTGYEGSKKKHRLFVYEISPESSSSPQKLYFRVDSKAVPILLTGRDIHEDRHGQLVIVGVARDRIAREQAFLLKMDKESGEIRETAFCCGRGLDGAYDLVELEEDIFLAGGYTTSHRAGARRSQALLWRAYGQENLDTMAWGGKQHDWINALARTTDQRIGVAAYAERGMPRQHFFEHYQPEEQKVRDQSKLPFRLSEKQGMVESFDSDGVIRPGEKGFLILSIQNMDSLEYQNLFLEVEPIAGIDSLHIPQKVYINRIRAGREQSIAIPFRASASLQTGRGDYRVQLRSNVDGRTLLVNGANERMIYLHSESTLQLSAFTISSTPAQRAQAVSLSFLLQNNSQQAVRDWQVEVKGCGFVVTASAHPTTSTLAGGDTIRLSYELQVSEEYPESILPLLISVKVNGKEAVRRTQEIQLTPFDRQSLASKGPVTIYLLSPNPEKYCVNFPKIYNDTDIKISTAVISKAPIPYQVLRTVRVVEICNGIRSESPLMPENKASLGLPIDSFQLDNGTRYYLIEGQHALRNDRLGSLVEIALKLPMKRPVQSTFAKFEVRPRNLYVLPIGIKEQLDYAQKDAGDIGDIFDRSSRDFYRHVIVDRALLKDTLLNEEIRLRPSHYQDKVSPDDLFITFLSCHGREEEGGYYLLTSSFYNLMRENPGTPLEDLISKGGMDYRRFVEELEKLNCQKLLIIDACHSGSAKDSDQNFSSSVPDELHRRSGITTLVSSWPHQKSYECSAYQNGAFTQAILRALSGDADKDHDQKITLRELYKHVRDLTPELVKDVSCNAGGNTQIPTMPQRELPEDIVIYSIPRKGTDQ